VSTDGLAFANVIGLKRPRNAIWPYYYYIILKVNSANKEGKSHYYMLYKDIQDLANLPPWTQLQDLIDHFNALPFKGEKTSLS
jgi:hypothetical protein